MLKALFLDLDKTLCDTNKADVIAREFLCEHAFSLFGTAINANEFAASYLTGIYRKWSVYQKNRYLPIIEQFGEGHFRNQLLVDLLFAQQIEINISQAKNIQTLFNQQRLAAFDFYPGLADFLVSIRNRFTLIVITNGPASSQQAKIERVNLSSFVHHIIVGGLEPEEKPAKSIFDKALTLANCSATEALHIGDSFDADIVGASNAGVKTLWVQHQQTFLQDSVLPDYTVVHPTEIPQLVNSIV